MPKSNTTLAVSDFVRAAMAAQKLSAHALAKRSGLSQSHISRILRGVTAPTTDMLERVAAAFDIPVAQLLRGATITATALVANPSHAKHVARLTVAYSQCDEPAQRLLLELAERLAKS